MTILVLLSLFAVVSTATLVPIASATCTQGSLNPKCALPGSSCDPIVMPRCEPYPP